MRKFLLILFSFVLLVSCTKSEYPSKAINIFIPYSQGGTTDKIGRLFKKQFEKVTNKKVNIINLSGASGSVATKKVFNEKSDGYNILLSADSLGTQRVMGLSKLSYDDFYKLRILANDPKVIVTKKGSKFDSIEKLLDEIKKNPAKIKMSYTGPGGSGHVQSLIYKKYGYDTHLVPYKGGRDALISVIKSETDFTNSNLSSVKEYIDSGDLNLLAVCSSKRLDVYKDVKALSEVIDDKHKYFDIEFTPLTLLIKKDVDIKKIEFLEKSIEKVINSKEWNEYFETNNIDKLYEKYKTKEEMDAFLKKWESKVSYLLLDSGVTKFNPKEFGIKNETD